MTNYHYDHVNEYKKSKYHNCKIYQVEIYI